MCSFRSLSGEFERQFFGDVMLFSMECLTAQGYPATAPSDEQIAATVREVETDMLHIYTTKHAQIVQQIAALHALFEGQGQWWQQNDSMAQPRAMFRHFIANMEANFGDDAAGYRAIHSGAHRAQRRQQIVGAIASYLRVVVDEAERRGYHFNRSKIINRRFRGTLPVTQGQLAYELNHLRHKLKSRAPERHQQMVALDAPAPHPLFRTVPGEVAGWEVVPPQ